MLRHCVFSPSNSMLREWIQVTAIWPTPNITAASINHTEPSRTDAETKWITGITAIGKVAKITGDHTTSFNAVGTG